VARVRLAGQHDVDQIVASTLSATHSGVDLEAEASSAARAWEMSVRSQGTGDGHSGPYTYKS
jgi:hypothetical protein